MTRAKNGMSDEPKTLERPKCQSCGEIAMWHVTDLDPGAGKTKTLHLCEKHAAEFFASPNRRADPRR
jgi:hypothetical protein